MTHANRKGDAHTARLPYRTVVSILQAFIDHAREALEFFPYININISISQYCGRYDACHF